MGVGVQVGGEIPEEEEESPIKATIRLERTLQSRFETPLSSEGIAPSDSSIQTM